VPTDRRQTPRPLKALRLTTVGVLTAAIALFVTVKVDAHPVPVPDPVPTIQHPVVGDIADVSSARPGVRVLFVGDSIVYVNDLPRMLHRMAADDPGGPQIYTAQYGWGGAWLMDFINAQDLYDLIQAHRWSDIVLQENTNISNNAQDFTDNAREPISRFRGWAVADGARTVLFDTPAYTHGYFSTDTNAAMQARIDRNYESVGDPVANVGDVWAVAATAVPGLELHMSDAIHPSVAGTYLSAAVFYHALTGRPSGPSTFTAGLPAAQTRALREIADRDTTPLPSVQ
jgi:hypothetical protein